MIRYSIGTLYITLYNALGDWQAMVLISRLKSDTRLANSLRLWDCYYESPTAFCEAFTACKIARDELYDRGDERVQ